jgi:hypothetical protein
VVGPWNWRASTRAERGESARAATIARMNTNDPTLPAHYRDCTRTLLRYAVVATIVALLSGVLFQESSKKLSYADTAPGLRLESVLTLALVHGHTFLIAVLIPIAMASALFLARKIGGAEVSRHALLWLTRGYLPFAALTVALMLYKGYHVLISVRRGARDLDAVDASYFGGLAVLRHSVYGATHVAMAVSLSVFAVALWRSLARGDARRGA